MWAHIKSKLFNFLLYKLGGRQHRICWEEDRKQKEIEEVDCEDLVIQFGTCLKGSIILVVEMGVGEMGVGELGTNAEEKWGREVGEGRKRKREVKSGERAWEES